MEQSVDLLSLKNIQLGFVYILLSNFEMTDVVFIIFFIFSRAVGLDLYKIT